VRRDHQSSSAACLDHVEVEAQLRQVDFMMVGSMRAYRKRQSMAIKLSVNNV